MKLIPLTQGQSAMVDDDDYTSLSKYRWFALRKKHGFYAARQERVRPGKQRTIYMHKVVLGIGPGVEGDHIDGNKLNNQRANLRIATRVEQMRGFITKRRSRSQYRGVSWVAREGKWTAQIRVNGRTKFLGYFTDEVSAAKAYDAGAKRYFGDRLHLNFPQ